MKKPHVWDSEADHGLTYCPAMIANGSLCTLLDYHGDQQQGFRYSTYSGFTGFKQMPSCMYRAGVRRNTVERDLIPLGHFEEEIDGHWQEPVHARQTLDIGCGTVRCDNEYPGAFRIGTLAFIHKQDPVFLIRKEIPEGRAYTFRYYFSEPLSREQVSWSKFTARKQADGKGAVCSWKTAGQHGDYTGTISVLCSCRADIEVKGCRVTFQFDRAPERIDFAIVYTDSCCERAEKKKESGADGARTECESIVYEKQANRSLRAKVRRLGFDGMLREQEALWDRFWGTFEVKLPDADLQRTFETSMYTLECSFTKWSIPVSINNAAWRGCYFAFNLFTEVFLAAGHPEEAKRIPQFRRNIISAAYHRAKGHAKDETRYVWICDEDGMWDVSVSGIWHDHIFHMANITEEAWNCYLYTRDREFLEETCYPVMKGCANFFMNEAVYTLADGRTVIGSCCDLERIGRSVKNAMLTTCGAIGTLEWAAAAARELGADGELAAKWRDTAAALRSGLPNDGVKYLPYGGAEEKSIGALGGFHPYPVLAGDDPLAQAALDDFCADTSRGNMYSVGKGLCTWYADWTAIAMFRSGRTEEGIRYLHSAFDKTGAFNAVFEINEPGTFVSFPWCSAPNASFAQAVIQMLLRWDYSGSVLHIGSFFPPSWRELSFTLRAPDDLTVHYERKDGKVTLLTVAAGEAVSGLFGSVEVEGKPIPLHIRKGETVRIV